MFETQPTPLKRSINYLVKTGWKLAIYTYWDHTHYLTIYGRGGILQELLTLDISDLPPCVFIYCKRKLSKHQYNIKSGEPRGYAVFSDAGWTEKRWRPTIEPRGILHHVDGCEGSSGVTLTPSLLPSDSQFRCPHLPLTHSFSPWSLAIFSPLVADSFHHCLQRLLLSDYLSVNTCTHMCPQLDTHTAKHHRIASRLLSETHVLGGTALDPQVNTEKNQNIMFSVMSAEKLMNNNSKKWKAS